MSNQNDQDIESKTIEILQKSEKPLSIMEITEVLKRYKMVSGKTPHKTVYSVIYRKEKWRKEHNLKPIFLKKKEGKTIKYYL